MTENNRNFTLKNIKKTVSYRDTGIMVINISYPVFEKCGQGKKEEAFVTKINKFYRHIAEKYTAYISEKYPAKAWKIYNTNGNIKLSFLMQCTVCSISEKFISVFADLSYFDGKKKKTVRLSQNWSEEKNALLPPSFCFETNGKAKRYITGIISGIASENLKSRNFSYYSDFERIIVRKFDFDNVYFVPKGTAFFYNAGVLSDEESPCVFVIPNERIDGVLKLSL